VSQTLNLSGFSALPTVGSVVNSVQPSQVYYA